MKTDKFIDLVDGRRLGFEEYGLTNGFPILAFHGTPGSRIWFEENDHISESLGVRLITVDRPGYGLSDPKPNRTIIDFCSDIQELVNYLKLDSYSVMGISGGGAYALALASHLNNNLYKTGLIASIYEFKKGRPPKEMCRPNKTGFFLAKYFSWLLRYMNKHQKYLLENDPERYIRESQKYVNHLCDSDQEVLQQKDTVIAMVLQMKEAFRINVNESVNELRLLSKDWSIEWNKITTPIEVWHGTEDTLSPINGMKKFVERIPHCTAHFLKGKGHFLDADENIWKAILTSLRN